MWCPITSRDQVLLRNFSPEKMSWGELKARCQLWCLNEISMAYQLPISGFSADGVRFKDMITSRALWVTSNDGETAQGTQGRRGQRAWPGVFSWIGWSAENLFSFFFFFNTFILFIYFWLHWVFIAARGLSLVAARGGYSSLQCVGFSLQWLLLLRSMGSRHAGFSSCSTQTQ